MSGTRVTNVPTYAENMLRACLQHRSIPKGLQSEWYDWSYERVVDLGANKKLVRLRVSVTGSPVEIHAECILDCSKFQRQQWFGTCSFDYQIGGGETTVYVLRCRFNDNFRMEVTPT